MRDPQLIHSHLKVYSFPLIKKYKKINETKKKKMFTIVPLTRVKTAEKTYMSNKQNCLKKTKVPHKGCTWKTLKCSYKIICKYYIKKCVPAHSVPDFNGKL